MSSKDPLRIAIIGGGIFAREVHLPAINALGDDIRVVAVYSRTEKSASACASMIPYPVETSNDIDSVLARGDFDAVDILLPIGIQDRIVQAALEAGKHVISEKPVATSVERGRELIELYRKLKDQVWMVAENYRYNEKFIEAARLIDQGGIGVPQMFNLVMSQVYSDESNIYFTAWRNDGSFYGGALMDSGVHVAATIRLLMGEVDRVSAAATKSRPDAPAIDTLCSNLEFRNGLIGSMAVTFATVAPGGLQITIIGDKGKIIVDDDRIDLVSGNERRTIPYGRIHDVQAELVAFVASVRHGASHRNPPEEALQDVAIILALLRSAETGRVTEVERV